MSAALETANLPPEAFEFIKAGTPKPQTVAAANVEAHPTVPPPASLPNGGANAKLTRQRPTIHPEEVVGRPGGIVALSFRLPSEIHEALLKISIDRKIRRQKPWTQQEIAAEALSQWLKKNSKIASSSDDQE